MHVQLRIHPAYLAGAGLSWGASVAGLAMDWPYLFEGGLLGSVAFVGLGLAVRRDPLRVPLAPRRELVEGGAAVPLRAKERLGTAAPRAGPTAPPVLAPTGSALDPVELEIVGAAEEVVIEPPKPAGVPWARAEAAGPLMFEGSKPLASEASRRVWAVRDPPTQAKVEPTGVIHGVCGRCGTRISVANRRPVWATCPVCGHSKLLN